MTLPIVLVPHPHVRVDPKVLRGSPYVVGSKVPVRRLYAFYVNGDPVEKLLRRYPQLGPAKVFDALAFALDNLEVMDADLARERAALARVSGEAPTPAGPPSKQIALPFDATPPAPPKGRRR